MMTTKIIEETNIDVTYKDIIQNIEPFAIRKQMTTDGRRKRKSYTRKVVFIFCPRCSDKAFTSDKKVRKGSLVECPNCKKKIKLVSTNETEYEAANRINEELGLPFWKHKNIKESEKSLTMYADEWKIKIYVDPLLRYSSINIDRFRFGLSFNKELRVIYLLQKKSVKNISFGGKIANRNTDSYSSETIEELLKEKEQSKAILPETIFTYFDLVKEQCSCPKWLDKNEVTVFELLAAEKYKGLYYLPNELFGCKQLRLASKKNKQLLKDSDSIKDIIEKSSGVKLFKSELSKINQLKKVPLEIYLYFRTFILNTENRMTILKNLLTEQNENKWDVTCNLNELVPSFLNPKRKDSNELYFFYLTMNFYGCKEMVEPLLVKEFVGSSRKRKQQDVIENIQDMLNDFRDIKNTLDFIRKQYVPLDRTIKNDVKKIIMTCKNSIEIEMRLSQFISQLRLIYTDSEVLLLDYNEIEKEKYNRLINEYTFRLAESNVEMEVVGDILNICVGTSEFYFHQVKCKNRFIIFVRDEQGYPHCTIEVTKDDKLLQAKGRFNNENYPLPSEIVEAVKTYCSEIEVNCEGHYDLKVQTERQALEIF